MSRAITRTRIINRRTSKQTSMDPAQSGAHYARLFDRKLTITGIRNQISFRAKGVLAARWENEETILVVIREEEEDEPVVVRAFRSRVQREWETEDARAVAFPSPDYHFVAIEFSLPNSAITVLPCARVVQDYSAKSNLGKAPNAVEWIGDDHMLVVRTPEQILQWSPAHRQFKKLPILPENESAPDEAASN